MKTIAFLSLFLIGLAQICFGLVIGPLRIHSIEAQFWHELGLSEQHSKVFSHYVGLLKGQWHIVSAMGVIVLAATALLLWSLERKL